MLSILRYPLQPFEPFRRLIPYEKTETRYEELCHDDRQHEPCCAAALAGGAPDRTAHSAADAERMGMIYKVCDDDKLQQEAMAIATTLSDMPTKGLGLTKKLLK